MLYFLLYFLLNSSFVLRLFDESVNSMFRGRIAWTRVTWGPLPWRLSVLEPVIFDPEGTPVIQAKSLEVRRLHLLDLLSLRIAATGVILEEPQMLLREDVHPSERDEYGEPEVPFNIVEVFWEPLRMPDDGSSVPHLTLSFEEIRIIKGRFALDMPTIWIEAQGIELEQGRFEMDIRFPERSMAIGALRAGVVQGLVQVYLGDDPRVRARDAVEEHLSWPIQGLALEGFNWSRFRFGLSQIQLRHRGDPFQVRRFRMDLNRPNLPAMGGRLEAQISDFGPHLKALGLEAVQGGAQILLRGEGEIDAFQGSLEAQGEGLGFREYELDRWSLKAHKDAEEQLNLHALEVEAYDGQLKATGKLQLLQGSGDLDLEFEGLDLTGLPLDLSDLLVDLLEGSMNGRLMARGARLYGEDRELSAALRLDLDRSGAPLHGLGSHLRLELIAALEKGLLDLYKLRLRSGALRASIFGTLLPMQERFKRLKGELALGSLSAVLAPLGLPLKGAAISRFRLSGPFTDPSVNASLRGYQLELEGFEGALKSRLSYAGGRLRIEETELETLSGHVEVKGDIKLLDPQLPLDLDISAHNLRLRSLQPQLRGLLRSARLKLSGPALKAKLDLQSAQFSKPGWKGLRFQSLNLSGVWSGSRFKLSRLRLFDEGDALLKLKGQLDLKRQRFKADLELNTFELNRLRFLLPELLPLSGQLSVNFKGEGSLRAPQGKGSLELKGVNYGPIKLGGGHLKFWSGEDLLAEQRGGSPQEVFNLKGRLFKALDIKASSPTRPGEALFSLEFKRLSLERFFPVKNLRLTLGGGLEGSFDLKHVRLGELRLELPLFKSSYLLDEQAGEGRLGLQADLPVRLRLKDGKLKIEQLSLRFAEQSLRLSGSLNPSGSSQLQLQGKLDLQGLEPLLREHFTRFQGLADLDLSISGPLNDPIPAGQIRLERLELVPRQALVGREILLLEPVELLLLSPYGPLPKAEGPVGAFHLTLRPQKPGAPNRLRIQRDEAQAQVTKLSGYFEGFLPTHLMLELDATELALSLPKILRMSLNAQDLRFEMWQQQLPELGHSETRMRLGGDLQLLRGVFMQDIAGSSELNQSFRDNLSGTSQAQSLSLFETTPLLKRLSLDLKVQGRSDFFIRNQVTMLSLNLEIRSDLSIRGYLAEPPPDAAEEGLQMEGQVRVLPDSSITYARRPFEVLEGHVEFGRGKFIQALLRASHTFRLRTDSGPGSTTFDRGSGDERLEEVLLQLHMNMDNPRSKPEIDLSLSSSSGASKIEVATLVLTGSYPSDLSGASSAQPATELLLGPLLGLIERPLEETLNLDLDIEPVSTGTLFISADKFLSRRLRLYTRTPVGEEDGINPQTFGLEYRINNSAYGELTNERLGNLNSTTARLRFRILLD